MKIKVLLIIFSIFLSGSVLAMDLKSIEEIDIKQLPYKTAKEHLEASINKLSAEQTQVANEKLTQYQMMAKDFDSINKKYQLYKVNRNDMKANRELYDLANAYSSQYQEVTQNGIKSIYIIIKKYQDKKPDGSLAAKFMSSPPKTYQELYKDYITPLNVSNANVLLEYFETSKGYQEKYEKVAQEVSEYSIRYETIKKENYRKAQKIKPAGDVLSLLVGFDNPVRNGAYILTKQPLVGIEVLQSVNGGIIISPCAAIKKQMYGGLFARETKNAFIVTSKKFADNQWIRGQMYLMFDGYYTYQGVLGNSNKIWKFKEISKAQYDRYAKIPNDFYFINAE